MTTTGMPGFEFRYRLSGGRPTIRRFVRKDAATIGRGDMTNLEGSEADLAATGDVDLIGAVASLAGEGSPTAVLVITDADAVYGVEDRSGRLKGATLDLTGLTGVQGVGDSLNAEFLVVLDCTAYEETLVHINAGRHYATLLEERVGLTGGELNAAIARDVVRHHMRHRGRGPTKARAFYRDDVVVVVLQEAMTPAERSLAATGRADAVRDVRDAFQEIMRADLVASIERLTGCKVQALMSANNVDPDSAAEVFILDRPVPSQPAAFESSGAA
jgi:uncharacterized protein YbcI